MNTQQYKSQLKEILVDLNSINILKKRNGTVEILNGKEIIENQKQFLIQLSDIKRMTSEIQEIIDWIQRTAESNND